MQQGEETPLIILPHFTPEEVKALETEHARRELLFKGRGLFGNDEERIRDAIQRGNYWTEQIAHLVSLGHSPYSEEMQHALSQLSDCFHVQGNIQEALRIVTRLVDDPERKAQFESTYHAILKDDEEVCECESDEHVVGSFPSFRHGGRMMPIRKCPECKTVNIG